MSDPAKVGPFEVRGEVGRGGMGVVFGARHPADGTGAAIKVLTGQLARREHYQRLFEREVQAMAKLRHPGIAAVLDTGRLERHAAARLGLPPDSPWLAMELVEGKSLAEIFRIGSWRSVEAVLASLLDALAHAHARGVLHRDIKPSNVLVSTDADGYPRYKLVDFGIARPSDDEQEQVTRQNDQVTGTPNYMAPEQILGYTRRHGPWTDLYALGCLTWKLLTGRAPFTDGDVTKILKGQLEGELPAFSPLVQVPEGFEAWLQRLLEKKPAARFQRAADAAHALALLVDNPLVEHPGAYAPDAQPDDAAPTILDVGSIETIALPELAEHASPSPGDDTIPKVSPTGAGTMLPPFPHTWRRSPGSSEQPEPPTGAGLGLYGMRTTPLVGRDAHKDRLWQLLGETRTHRSLRGALLTGGPGVGKSRLAEWLAWRAHEVGAVSVMRAVHSPRGGQRDGLAPMLARFFRLASLGRARVADRLRKLFGHADVSGAIATYDALALAELIAEDDTPRRTEGFETRQDKFAAIARLIRVAALERPVLLWLEDIHWDAESARFAAYVMRHCPDLPVTVVMTARSEAIGAALEPMTRLHDLCGRIELGPLSDEDQNELVEQLLGLQPDVAAQVVARTAGNPLFAVQLVGDWVERGVLVPGEQGFELAAGASLQLPDDIHGMWRRRLQQVLVRFEPHRRSEVRTSIELAAALGREVDTREWLAASDELGVEAGSQSVSVLIKQGLARRTAHGWAFAHTMLRESLERSARDAGQWRRYQLACSRALTRLSAHPSRRDLRRIAEHAYEGGDDAACIETTYRAAQMALVAGVFEEMGQILELRRRALERSGLGPESRERARQWWLEGNLNRNFERIGRAEELAERTIALTRKHGWREELGHALQLQGQLYRDHGDFEAGIQTCTASKEHFEALGDDFSTGHVLRILAMMHRNRAELEKALEYQQQACAIYERLDAYATRARVLTEMGYTSFALGRVDRARAYLREALDEARRWGNRNAEASGWNNLGEVARFEEDWELAWRCYTNALDVWQERGDRSVHIGRFNLAVVEVSTERYDTALPRLQTLLDALPRAGLEVMVSAVHLGLAACTAHRADWADFDAHLDQARRQLDDTTLIHKDVAWLAERAGRAALASGGAEHARAILELSLEQWRALGDDEAAERVRRQLPTR